VTLSWSRSVQIDLSSADCDNLLVRSATRSRFVVRLQSFREWPRFAFYFYGQIRFDGKWRLELLSRNAFKSTHLTMSNHSRLCRCFEKELRLFSRLITKLRSNWTVRIHCLIRSGSAADLKTFRFGPFLPLMFFDRR
jgi:hypothetical protein